MVLRHSAIRMIGLADCNNFFVSCERTRRPDLEGKAVVVLSNNDGCVVARSNEAKQAGVKMGQPAFQIRDMIMSGKVIALSGDHLLYRAISIRVHDIFRRFAPQSLDYSVDEAFLDMHGIPVESLGDIGEAIWQTCWNEERIPVTVGFAPTKTLAKIVTERAKKMGSRVGVVADMEEMHHILESTPIEDLWGIGRRLARKMYQWGIYNVAQLADKDSSWIRSRLGVQGEKTWRELNGVSCIELAHIDRNLQDSISESRTFPYDVSDYDYIRARIVIYTSDCARRLRAMGGACSGVTVYLQSNRFHQEQGFFSPQAGIRLPNPTDDTARLVDVAIKILDSIFIEGMPIKRAGVIFSEITSCQISAPSLFDTIDPDVRAREDSRRLMKALDRINEGPGHPRIMLASQITKGHPGQNDGYSSSFQAPKKLPSAGK